MGTTRGADSQAQTGKGFGRAPRQQEAATVAIDFTHRAIGGPVPTPGIRIVQYPATGDRHYLHSEEGAVACGALIVSEGECGCEAAKTLGKGQPYVGCQPSLDTSKPWIATRHGHGDQAGMIGQSEVCVGSE